MHGACSVVFLGLTSPKCASSECIAQRGAQREVSGRERAYANHVHVVLDSLLCGLLRRLEQRADVDIEAEVGLPSRGEVCPLKVSALGLPDDPRPPVRACALSRRVAHFMRSSSSGMLRDPTEARDRAEEVGRYEEEEEINKNFDCNAEAEEASAAAVLAL